MLMLILTDPFHRGNHVDLIADNWKKYPLLLIGGEFPVSLPEAISFPVSGIGSPGSLPINDFYVLLSVAENELASVLSRLEAVGLSPAQVLPLLKPETPFSHPKQAYLGIFDLIAGESPEEFRARLLGKLEAQRQKMLCVALVEANESGILRALPEHELAAALDTCRMAHALACSYSLSPMAHVRVLRLCLGAAPAHSLSWPADLAIESLIVEASNLLLECFKNSQNFREMLKERAGALPFRARNELLHHVESCLGHLLRGKSHAA